MRALTVVMLCLLAGCVKAENQSPPPTMVAEAKAIAEAPPSDDPGTDLDRLAKAHAELTNAMEVELTKLVEVAADWERTYSAALVAAEDDAERAELYEQNAEFRAKNDKLIRELDETYGPILEDLNRRLVDAALRVKEESDRPD